jgi:S-adenosylmethionine:tRNA ribosyltransferase-isomerase
MRVRDFDFELPSELIAQRPPSERGSARLLHLARASGHITHETFAALPTLLRAGDLLVVNNTRVFPARLLGRRVPTGGAVECLLIAPSAADLGQRGEPESAAAASPAAASVQVWEALMHPGQKMKPGARVAFGDPPSLFGEVLERRYYGRRLIRLWTEDSSAVETAVDAVGHVPLPPYIRRADERNDQERYQTVFADPRGSVAAPTAGLHFTDAILQSLGERGVEVASITLHVGYGTFQPVRVETVEEHHVEGERYDIPSIAADRINLALGEKRRVIAVGTTTTRALESVARESGRIGAGRGTTDLFIYPGFTFRVISGLLTNFHLPRSSLLMLVAAFGGTERVLAAYAAAVAAGYRFYSYGDAMLVL